MDEEAARAAGYNADIVVAAYVKTAVDPFPQLLLAPALAIPAALEKANLTLQDIDVFEIHEAFAAQVTRQLRPLHNPCTPGTQNAKPMGKSYVSVIGVTGVGNTGVS